MSNTPEGTPTGGQWDAEAAKAAIPDVLRLAQYGMGPQDPVTITPGPPTAPAGDDIFTDHDLLTVATAAERFRMPGGKFVWVHPMNAEGVAFANIQAAREVAALPVTTDRERSIHFELRVKIWQVIRCCKRGPEVNALPCFQPESAEVFRRNPYWETVKRICALSDSLGEGDDVLPQAVRAFFGRVRNYVTTCASRLPTGSPELSVLRTALEDFVTFVSRVETKGMIEVSDFLEFPAVPPPPAPQE